MVLNNKVFVRVAVSAQALVCREASHKLQSGFKFLPDFHLRSYLSSQLALSPIGGSSFDIALLTLHRTIDQRIVHFMSFQVITIIQYYLEANFSNGVSKCFP